MYTPWRNRFSSEMACISAEEAGFLDPMTSARTGLCLSKDFSIASKHSCSSCGFGFLDLVGSLDISCVRWLCPSSCCRLIQFCPAPELEPPCYQRLRRLLYLWHRQPKEQRIFLCCYLFQCCFHTSLSTPNAHSKYMLQRTFPNRLVLLGKNTRSYPPSAKWT